jgi:hypothetical protein
MSDKRLISTETVDCHCDSAYRIGIWEEILMMLKKPLGTVLDVLSYTLSWMGITFLFGAGIEKFFVYSSVTPIHQHRWLGFLMVAGAIALAIRVPKVVSYDVSWR